MFYRRKIILALIQVLGGELEKLRIQKLLFLYSQKKKDPEYEFVPYKFGCYSFSANADLSTMVKKGNLDENENFFIKNDTDDYLKTLKADDKKIILEVANLYGNMDKNQLIKHTYINFPYYAVNSTIAEKVLNEQQLERVNRLRVEPTVKTLFTIGYEGVSLEKYLNKLVTNKVKLLVDVRKNPNSMKYGFSKSALIKYCNSLGIEYIHIPEVGIESDKRQTLNTQEDYDNLFKQYKKTTLAETEVYQEKIIKLLEKFDRVALTCFEADICQCHRKPLAESIKNNPKFDYELKHI